MLKNGTDVSVKHGTGTIVGIDQPESRCPRCMVHVTTPWTTKDAEFVGRFKNHVLCYMPKEVSRIVDGVPVSPETDQQREDR